MNIIEKSIVAWKFELLLSAKIEDGNFARKEISSFHGVFAWNLRSDCLQRIDSVV